MATLVLSAFKPENEYQLIDKIIKTKVSTIRDNLVSL